MITVFRTVVTFLLFVYLRPSYAAENWPQFLGPDGNGHAKAVDLPLQWNEEKNVAWKTLIHDRGWSSPVIFGNQIWVTTATSDGRQLYTLCIDRESGKILRDLKLFDVEKPQYCHPFNSYASPTPIIEPGRVYVTFGSTGTACIDAEALSLAARARPERS